MQSLIKDDKSDNEGICRIRYLSGSDRSPETTLKEVLGCGVFF